MMVKPQVGLCGLGRGRLGSSQSGSAAVMISDETSRRQIMILP